MFIATVHSVILSIEQFQLLYVHTCMHVQYVFADKAHRLAQLTPYVSQAIESIRVQKSPVRSIYIDTCKCFGLLLKVSTTLPYTCVGNRACCLVLLKCVRNILEELRLDTGLASDSLRN